MIQFTILAYNLAFELAHQLAYNIVLATVITNVNYDHKTFIVQATDPTETEVKNDKMALLGVDMREFFLTKK